MRWEPFSELMSLRDAMDRLFEDSFVRPRAGVLAPALAGDLALDMYETDNDLVITAPLPGAAPEDVDITITGDTLAIKAEIKEEEDVKRDCYYCQERRFGSFSRSVSIPIPVQVDKAEARFKDGILTLTLPKAEEIKPKTIKIKTDKKQNT
jgi:HSP20 family protein